MLKKAEAGPSRERGAKPFRILGLDPGLASTGWGLLEVSGNRLRYLAHGCIETEASSPRAERLFFIYREICRVLETYKPREGAVENLYFGRNVSSAMAVAEARGVIILALVQQGLEVAEFTPGAIKTGVAGVSRAGKGQVQEMVRLILGLESIPKPDHAADALAAAICAAHSGPDL
ncbi:MAG: crossover junction endodeoxyribonuclease RuvC [Treponema sp.]|nr:crossover junction endodeoxyribonuclease RuvC [Treponema sp.]